MPNMLFQEGNQFGAKNRLFESSLRRAIAQDNANRLRRAAEQLLTQAADGQQWAITFQAAKLDGLPKASTELTISRDVGSMSLEELQQHFRHLLAGEAVDIDSRPVEAPRGTRMAVSVADR